MKRLFFSLILMLAMAASGRPYFGGSSTTGQIDVYFSPEGGCTDAVVHALNHATNTVLVQAYSSTSAPIAKALVTAYRRGVKIQVILDKSQRTEKYSSATFLAGSF